MTTNKPRFHKVKAKAKVETKPLRPWVKRTECRRLRYSREFDESKIKRDAGGQFSKSAVNRARRDIGSGKAAPKTAEQSFPSHLSGKSIRRHVELAGGARIHPDELHRIKHADDGEHFLSTDEMLTVREGGKTRKARSFSDALRGILPNQKGTVTIQGPHGYSATMTAEEWRKITEAWQFFEWLDAQDWDALKEKGKSDEPAAEMVSGPDVDDYFAPHAAESPRLFSNESAGQWITIGGVKGEDGKRRGGSPVFVQNGRITKGAPSLTGRSIEAMDKPGEGSSVRTANKQELEYQAASWRKKARKEGIDAKHLDALANDIRQHHDAANDDRAAMLKDIVTTHPWLRGIIANKGRGIDQHSIKTPAGAMGLDQISQEIASNPRYWHLFGGGDGEGVREDHSEKLFDYLVAGKPQAMSHDDAYEQAFDHLMNEKHRQPTHNGGETAADDDWVPFAFDYRDNPMELVRRMPRPEAIAYARGILEMLKIRPDLRRDYSTADLAYLESLVRGSQTP